MQTILRLRAARYVAWMLMASVAGPYPAASAPAVARDEASKRTVLLLPQDNAGKARPSVAAELDRIVKEGLESHAKYRLVIYSEQLPAVQRLVSLQPEKEEAITAHYTTDEGSAARAVSLARSMLADLAVLQSLDDYQFVDQAGRAEIKATALLLDAKTGKELDRIQVTGQAAKSAAAKTLDESSLAMGAAKDAGRKIVSAITGEPYKEAEPARAPIIQSEPKKSKKSWVTMLLLSLGVGLLLGGSGSGDGSSGSPAASGDDPPAPPF